MFRRPVAMTGLCLTASALMVLGVAYDRLPLLFAAMVPMTAWAMLSGPVGEPREDGTGGIRWFGPALLVGVCFFMEPKLSDDHQRYLWEGFVQNQGYSPYSHSPRSLYDRLDHPAEGRINHDELTAIYPPLAQYLFRLSAWIGSSVFFWKTLILVTLAGTWLLARENGRAVLLLAPMVLVEGIWHGHLDVVGLLPGFWLVHSLNKGRPGSAGCALAAMVGLKLIPVLFLPLVFLHLPRTQRMRFLGIFTLVLVVVYLPYLGQLEYLFQSFLRFSQSWHFNNPLYKVLRYVLPNKPARLLYDRVAKVTPFIKYVR